MKISLNSIIDVVREAWNRDSRNGLPYSGKAVREAIQSKLGELEEKKIGYFAWSDTIDSSNNYHLWGFKSKEDYEAYKVGDKEDDEIKALLLIDIALPISTVQGDSYAAYLFTTLSATKNIIVSENKLEIPLRFHAVRITNGERLNVGSKGTLVVQRKSGTSGWITVGEISEALDSTDYSNTEEYKTFDIGSYLIDGQQQIRLQGRYTYTDGDGNEQSQASTYVLVGASVTKANLTLSCRQDYHTPIMASVQQTNGFPYSYLVNGAVQKTLHIEITGGNGKVLPINIEMSSTEDGTTVRNTYKDATDTYQLFKHGVRLVKAWVTCDDGLGGTLTSDVLENRFMVVNTSTSGMDKTKPYLMIQNLVKTAVNYTQMSLCDFAIYSPKVNDDGSVTNDGGDINVIFYLTSYAESFPDGKAKEYFRIEQDVQPGVQNTLNTTVEIEDDDAGNSIDTYFRVYRKENGKEVDFLKDSVGTDNCSIKVDNSDSYAPTAGATFLINPKVRNNTEENPATILNARANNAVVESTWSGFGYVNDGWVTAEDGVKVLRVPAGSSLNIKYNPFAQFVTTPDSAMTLELDVAINNVTNEEDPIVQICESVASSWLGLRLMPQVGYMYSASDTTESEIDFPFQEGKRTHIAINIHNSVITDKGDALTPTGTSLNTSAKSCAFIRVFVNGNPYREIKFSTTNKEEFCTGAMSNGGIKIGQSGADIDIYSIRCYTNMQLESSDIIQDYISTLPTTAEKQAVRNRNNMLTGETIDIEKVKALGYRCLVLHGVEPYMYDAGAKKVWWEIFQYDQNGKYIPELSGTICKETSTKSKRQGSTANTYYYSNIQTKISDGGEITVALAKLGSNLTWVLNDPVINEETQEVTQTVSIYGGNLGALDPVKASPKEYEYIENNGVPSVKVPDGWIDGNGMYRGKGFMITEGTPYADKLVLKINYASSMQAHLPGCCRWYNDLYIKVVGKNPMLEACPTARVTKYTEPVYFFTQGENGKPVFRGGGAFGAGKMDKPTIGYQKKLYPNFAMFEGSDNNYELTDMRVPFILDVSCSERITYSPSDEGYFYNGLQNLDFDAGATDVKDDGEHPKAALTNRLAEIWNFLYLHAPRIKYYNGTFSDFQLSKGANNTQYKYWVTQGDDAYLLKRYNFVDKKWVDAGLWKNGAYEKIDLRTYEMTKDAYDNSQNQAQYSSLNKEFIAAIVAHCKVNIGNYVKVKSLQFHYCFQNHFMAGTDNCSKNTYYVLVEQADGKVLLELYQDDVDTILATDNNGRFTKKYYVDRMHPYAEGDSTTSQYEGMQNVLFNLCEEMYEETRELQSMMKSIFSAMCQLVSENDYIRGFDGSVKVSLWGCLWKYLFSINSYFSEIAYCEQARIRYEYPAQLGFVSTGSGARGVAPITQSCGSSLEGEIQFMKQRIIYMASYAAWGNLFDGGKSENIGIQDVTDSFAMQAFHLPNSSTSATEYKFTVKPHQYIYPTGMMGQTSVDPHVRVAPDEAFELNLGTTTSNDTGLAILGINYYHSIGNIGDLSTSPNLSVTVNGKRLTEVIAEPTKMYEDETTGEQVPAFRPNNIVITASQVRKVSINGCVGIGGSLSLSNLNRLESLDIRKTKIYAVQLPSSKVLSEIHYPDGMTRVTLSNLPALDSVTIDGASKLTALSIDNGTVKMNTAALVTQIYDYKTEDSSSVSLSSVSLENVNYNSFRADVLQYLSAINNAVLSGRISLVDGTAGYLTYAVVMMLIEKYGDIQSESNELYISYPKRTINNIVVRGDKYINKLGKWDGWEVAISPTTGNNIAVKDGRPAISWKFVGDNASQAAQYATFLDDVLGILLINKLSDPSLELKFTVEVKMTLTDGNVLTYNKGVGFYKRIPKIGDYAYFDGSFDDELDTSKTCLGFVFMKEKLSDTQYKFKIYSKENVNFASTDGSLSTVYMPWGLFPSDPGNRPDLWLGQGVLDEIKEAIQATDVADVANLPNKGSNYLYETQEDGTEKSTNYITQKSYQDANKDDGYKELNANSSLMDFNGKSNTDAIVSWAKNIINKYLNDSYPTTLQELSDMMAKIMKEKGDAGDSYTDRWRQLFYAPAFGCSLYEPKMKDGEEASEQYKKGNWYLPSEGELARVYNFYANSRGWVNNTDPSADYANENPENEAQTPVFANFLVRAKNANAANPIATPTRSGYWTSTEVSRSSAWHVYFNDGRTDGSNKYGSGVVRPCVAFTFNL